MDPIDAAQDREAMDRELALNAQRQRTAASFAPRMPGADALCIDCDEPIETARLAVLAGATSRCASCARDYEQRLRQRGIR